MIFTTWPFFFFLILVFVCYWWVVPAPWRRAFLLIASLTYFTYSYPPFTLLLTTMTLAVYGLGSLIFALRAGESPDRAKAALIGGLILCAGTLAFFKYSGLVVGVWNALTEKADIGMKLPLPHILVPLGISFFTFEFIHYLTDLYHGRVKRVSLLDFSLFAFFFPSLVSGPIKRFQIFQEQSESLGRFQAVYASEGIRRIVMGLAKKLIIADSASQLTLVFASPHGASRTALWLAMYAYAVKIYYDFSGYTDIAIGCAQLLGYRLPENFDKPYRQSNLSLFWNRWHMSLSSWIRDYLFIPLGGSRCSKARTLLNLTAVMAICGLWHGANWNFVAWGLWHGLGLGAHRVYRPAAARVPDTRPVRWFGTLVTFHFVCIGWVLFAAPNLPTALVSLRRMF